MLDRREKRLLQNVKRMVTTFSYSLSCNLKDIC